MLLPNPTHSTAHACQIGYAIGPDTSVQHHAWGKT